MKKLLSIVTLSAMMLHAAAQDNMVADPLPPVQEDHGRTLNLAVGTGYYGYVGHALPLGNINYEFGVFRNFTLAPTVSVYATQDYNYWGDDFHAYRDYSYRQTYVPMGIKASYYFDEWLHAGSRWDFYIGTSAGFVYKTTSWEDGYGGTRTVKHDVDPVFVAMHIGSEYHFTKRAGVFLDLSNSVSTVGLAIHF